MSGKTKNQKQNKVSKTGVGVQKKKKNGPKKKKNPVVPTEKVIRPVINNRNQKAQGSRDNIMIPATANLSSVLTSYLGLVGMALSRGYDVTGDNVYWAYTGGVRDLIDIMSGQVPGVFGRLRYLNEILGSFSPKSVPFRGVGEIAYYWSDVAGIVIANTVSVRGFVNYMYVIGGPVAGPWSMTQQAGPNPSNVSDTSAALARLFDLLSDKTNVGQKYCKGIDLGTIYARDVSAYASSLEYYGAGSSTTTGPAMSVENEVPFMSILLAVMSSFVAEGTRVSRYLKFGSGDSTAAFALGSLADFELNWYKTAYAPVYKFIDLQEVTDTLIFWYVALCKQAATTWPSGPSEQAEPALVGFNFTARQFSLMVRQCILSIFNDTQSVGQHLKPTTTANGFEALRVGSNCYGKVLSENMLVPSILRENIANLLMCYLEVQGRYYNPKNIQLIIPVWGTWVTSADQNPQVETWDSGTGTWVQAPLFQPLNVNDPNIIDATNAGGDVIDLNNSNLIGDFIANWNFCIRTLECFSLPVSYLGGSAGTGRLLTLTRAYEYKDPDMTPTPFNKALIKRMYNNDLVKKTKKTLERTTSGKQKIYDVVEESIMLPGGSGLNNAFPIAYTSLATIDETVKQALPYIILPFIPIVPTEAPTINQWRTTGIECKIMFVKSDTTSPGNSRISQIISTATGFAPGIAASGTDEFADVIKVMNGAGEGGFFGDLVGNLVGAGAKLLGNAIPI